MHFVAWNGERWSMPFQPNELITDGSDGLMDREGCSVAWDADGYRGENWIALKHWTEERAKAITSNSNYPTRNAKTLMNAPAYWMNWRQSVAPGPIRRSG